MNFPTRSYTPIENLSEFELALGRKPLQVFKGKDIMAVFGSEDEIRNLFPDFSKIKKVDQYELVV